MEQPDIAMSRKPPDFVIAGASKCGTTSLYKYLTNHDGIFMTHLKEPSFFLPEHLQVIKDTTTYCRLFKKASSHQLCGEASALYLYYEESIASILSWNPNVKFIVAIRNPIDMAVSYHNQTLYSFEEVHSDFEKAWRLSEDSNRVVGPNCLDRRLLNYKAICRLGRQVENLMRLAHPKQVHVVVFDDLRADPRGVYERVLNFLGLRSDERHVFPTLNPRKEHRSRSVAELVLAPPALLMKLKWFVRRHAPVLSKKVARQILEINKRPGARLTLDPRLRAEMVEEFSDDVELLGDLLGRNLCSWVKRG